MKRCRPAGSEAGAMNAVKPAEVHNSSPQDGRRPELPPRPTQAHGDDGQQAERTNRESRKDSPEGKNVLQLRLQQRRTREQLAEQGIMPLNHGKFPKQEDSYAFEEDSSSESLSPDQHHSDESQGSACPSSEAVGSAASSSSSPALTSPQQGAASRDLSDPSQEEALSAVNSSQDPPPTPLPAIAKSKTSDKNRHKKPKDVKPKVKKLKYHQYIPPDQKAEKSPPPMDSAYARLLQQQQLFLQLQILSQQKHAHTHSQTQQSQQQPHTHPPQTQPQAQQRPTFSYQPHPQAHAHKGTSEQSSACSSSDPSSTANSSSSSPVKNTFPNQSSISPVKPGPLPANLDDLKVSELRQHLRIRGMPVSGTKTALIERLRPFKDPSVGSSPTRSSDITTLTFPVTPSGSLSSYQSPSSSSTLSQGGYYPYPSTSSTPPISPASSDLSLSGSLPDSFSDVPMSSPTQFALQSSPAQLGMEDCQGGGVQQRLGEGGGADGPEAEKDKMLVEKQKVIEELTWKLHQEQRQVEELKMQLHKRKRCYGATQDAAPPPSHPSMLHQQQTPAMMGQHFFGVTIKQEPMSLSSSCPLSSPKQLKSPPGSCMEDMGHCNNPVANMVPHGGPQCMDTGPSCASPSTMSAFLSPQCSPQDSPIRKLSSSSQPSSPNNPYLLSPPLGRDGCGHPHNHANGRVCNMQMQQRGGGQQVNRSYPQVVFPASADCGLNHNDSAKAEGQNMQQKMSVLPSPRHVGQKCQVSPPAFSSSDSDASDLRQPPCYEDAVKQQLTRSQQMDELLDVLIESGEMPANAREERERSSVTKVVPHITVSPGCLIPRFHRHYEHPSLIQLPYDHAAGHPSESHLQTLLVSPIGRGGEVAPLKMAADDRGQEVEGNRDVEGYSSPHNHHCRPHHPQQDKLLTHRDLMDTPLSPINNKVPTVPEVQGMVSMTFSETPWETMEWLDLTSPSSAAAFSIAQPSAPSIFNTEFLDVTDISLNSAMDLHLEHW
ncbi:myocardin [Cololabis saira]|uniref:myocardin n=1 Tax=Cololabis saira TaxID=129043 RepID=UPI002AD1FD1B|nr:myocardin [Cololabis saira]